MSDAHPIDEEDHMNTQTSAAFFVGTDKQGMIVRSDKNGFYIRERSRNAYDYGRTVHDHTSWERFDTRDAAIDEWFSPFTFPGAYPVGFYGLSDDGDLDGDVLCANCARERYTAYGEQFVRQCENDDYDNDLTCDNCYQVIAEATDTN